MPMSSLFSGYFASYEYFHVPAQLSPIQEGPEILQEKLCTKGPIGCLFSPFDHERRLSLSLECSWLHHLWLCEAGPLTECAISCASCCQWRAEAWMEVGVGVHGQLPSRGYSLSSIWSQESGLKNLVMV
ncbi:hypothetical protein EDC96DRAFT_569016 [Choanephora cucurbitarum]|nr:hypothetical protein EDC96DRAFT_569016 [Choanephora cucurbitarum]